MCWNWKVSIGSFTLISIISLSLYNRNLNNDRLLAIFLFSYGSMQLFETFIWLGQDKGMEDWNKIGSIGASALLYAHPLAFMIGIWADKTYNEQGTSMTQEFKIFLMIAIIFFSYGLYQIGVAYENNTSPLVSYPDAKSNHLVWDFPSDYPVTLIFIGIGILYYIYPKNKMFSLAILIYFLVPIAILLSTMKVEDRNQLKNYSGSYWCWYVAAFSFLFYMVNPMLQNEK